MRRILAIAFALTIASTAEAHSLTMTISITAADITVRTEYSGNDHESGTPTVTITDVNTKAIVAQGKVGVDGRWTTPLPPPGKYKIVAEDEFGHRIGKDQEIVPGQTDEIVKAGKPFFSTTTGMLVALGIICLITLVGYLIVSKKKI